ncbi:MAG: hypothetical protein V1854_01660 [Methanobacteriota archaeon]
MKLIYTEEFKGDIKKIRDNKIQTRIKKIIQKIMITLKLENRWDTSFFLLEVLKSLLSGFYMNSRAIL